MKKPQLIKPIEFVNDTFNVKLKKIIFSNLVNKINEIVEFQISQA
jgi:hypothetical protein